MVYCLNRIVGGCLASHMQMSPHVQFVNSYTHRVVLRDFWTQTNSGHFSNFQHLIAFPTTSGYLVVSSSLSESPHIIEHVDQIRETIDRCKDRKGQRNCPQCQ
jgi:hypothetical protein